MSETPPVSAPTPSQPAREAAESIYSEMFKLGGLDRESVINGIAAIISRYFPAATETVGKREDKEKNDD